MSYTLNEVHIVMIATATTGTQSKLKVTGNCRVSCTGDLFSGVELRDRDCMTYNRTPIIQAAVCAVSFSCFS